MDKDLFDLLLRSIKLTRPFFLSFSDCYPVLRGETVLAHILTGRGRVEVSTVLSTDITSTLTKHFPLTLEYFNNNLLYFVLYSLCSLLKFWEKYVVHHVPFHKKYL
jgi:hypothetical protein